MFDPNFLSELRVAEFERVVDDLGAAKRILDFGAGDGTQAREFARRGYDAVAIDLPSSRHAAHRTFPIIDYDGGRLPLPDDSFDAVFSSNVLEHVRDPAFSLAEIRRVTRPGGRGVHLLPSVAWRAWTSLAGAPTSVVALAALFDSLAGDRPGDSRASRRSLARTALTAALPIAHGNATTAFSEFLGFRESVWWHRLEHAGFEVLEARPSGIFHTGHMLLGSRLPIRRRERLAEVLGSAANVFIVRKQ